MLSRAVDIQGFLAGVVVGIAIGVSFRAVLWVFTTAFASRRREKKDRAELRARYSEGDLQ
jgi:uncharacterized protein (DUF2062 family)